MADVFPWCTDARFVSTDFGAYNRRSIIFTTNIEFVQTGHHLRRRQTRRRHHQPHRPPWMAHRIPRTKPTHERSPHVRPHQQPINHNQHAPMTKPEKLHDQNQNTDLTKYMRYFKSAVTFQSTPPRGEATEQDYFSVHGRRISIHASPRGGDTRMRSPTTPVRSFQSTPPRGEATKNVGDEPLLEIFQSTPPRGEATNW